jgi:hypothetical protein
MYGLVDICIIAILGENSNAFLIQATVDNPQFPLATPRKKPVS